MPQKGLTYRFPRVINKIVFPKIVLTAFPQPPNHSKQTITLVITQLYSHLHSVVNLNNFFLSWVEFTFFFFFVVELSYLRLEVIFHCFSYVFIYIFVYMFPMLLFREWNITS